MMCFDTGGVSSLLDRLSFLAWENGHKLFFTEFLHFRQVHKGFDQIEFWTQEIPTFTTSRYLLEVL